MEKKLNAFQKVAIGTIMNGISHLHKECEWIVGNTSITGSYDGVGHVAETLVTSSFVNGKLVISIWRDKPDTMTCVEYGNDSVELQVDNNIPDAAAIIEILSMEKFIAWSHSLVYRAILRNHGRDTTGNITENGDGVVTVFDDNKIIKKLLYHVDGGSLVIDVFTDVGVSENVINKELGSIFNDNLYDFIDNVRWVTVD